MDINKLEQVKLNAARIVTEFPVFSCVNFLYYETGWATLTDRLKCKKLNLTLETTRIIKSHFHVCVLLFLLLSIHTMILEYM